MIRLFSLLLVHDNKIKMLMLFNVLALIILVVLHYFMKKRHHKLWVGLCCIPLAVVLLFYAINAPGAVQELFWQRHISFGIAALFILLWGLVTYFRGSFGVYTAFEFFVNTLLCGSVFLVTMVSDDIMNLGDYSKYGWTESVSKTIDQLEESYVTRYWKDIDFEAMREKYLPLVEKAEKENDEAAILELLYELKYDLYDGHVWVIPYDIEGESGVIRNFYGNDFGLSLFRDNVGEVLAVLVEPGSEAEKTGIHNGTVVTRWNGVAIDDAAAEVKCIDPDNTFVYVENEDIFRPAFLAGHGEEKVEISFIADDGTEKTVQLSSIGSYSKRLKNLIETVYSKNIFSSENYYTCMLDQECGYLRVQNEDYENNDYLHFIYSELSGKNPKLYKEIRDKIQDLEDKGMKRLIIDLRNNSGGYSNISSCIASLFVDVEIVPAETYLINEKFGLFRRSFEFGEALWSDIPITVIVNGETCSAGDVLAYWLSRGDNTALIGNTYQWGSSQATGGRCILTDGKIEFYYPIYPALTENNEPIAEPKSDRKSVVNLDYHITYSKEEVVELFSDSEGDHILEAALEYVYSMEK